jgi:hypothetical protein
MFRALSNDNPNKKSTTEEKQKQKATSERKTWRGRSIERINDKFCEMDFSFAIGEVFHN